MATISLFLSQIPATELLRGIKSGAIAGGMIAIVGTAEALARRIIPRIMEPKEHALRASLALSVGISLAEALQCLEEQVDGTDPVAIGAGMVAGIYFTQRPFSASDSILTAYAASAAAGALMTTGVAWISASI